MTEIYLRNQLTNYPIRAHINIYIYIYIYIHIHIHIHIYIYIYIYIYIRDIRAIQVYAAVWRSKV